MSTILEQQCLTINNDEDKATIFEVDLTEPPIWDALEMKSTVEVLKVDGSNSSNKLEDTKNAMLQLFIAIQSHRAIQSIQFYECEIMELGHLAYWWLTTTTTTTTRELQGDDQDQARQLELMFENCNFDICAATTLSFMLKAGSITDLSFANCNFNDASTEIIGAGLKANGSLTNFDFRVVDPSRHREDIMNGALQMLDANQNIETLSLDMANGCYCCWDVYRKIENHATLERLQLYNACLDVSSVGAVMKMCQDIKTLNNLAFSSCNFTPSGIQFLIEQLSKHVALDDLDIEFCHILEPFTLPLELSWRGLQVKNILLTKLGKEKSRSSWFDEIANNSNIQSLDLSDAVDSDQDFQCMCDSLISTNRGPTTLTVQEVKRHAPMIIESLQEGTKLRTLTIGDIDEAGLVLLAQGLSSITSLRQLNIGFQDVVIHYSEEFFRSLRDSMEVNTTLWSMSLRGVDSDDAMAKAYLPRIRYLLAINRVGRSSLLTANVPVGVWANVLARCPKDPDGIFFVLTGKPDLSARPCGKRKRSEAKLEP
jgi:hypothetical protein